MIVVAKNLFVSTRTAPLERTDSNETTRTIWLERNGSDDRLERKPQKIQVDRAQGSIDTSKDFDVVRPEKMNDGQSRLEYGSRVRPKMMETRPDVVSPRSEFPVEPSFERDLPPPSRDPPSLDASNRALGLSQREYDDLIEDVRTQSRVTYDDDVPMTYEWRRFFSRECIVALRRAIRLKAGGHDADLTELIDCMLRAYADNPCVASDPTHPARENVTAPMADRHVKKLMRRVVEEMSVEVESSNALWDAYAQNINGPSDLPDDPIDGRTWGATLAAANIDWMLDDRDPVMPPAGPFETRHRRHHGSRERSTVCGRKKKDRFDSQFRSGECDIRVDYSDVRSDDDGDDTDDTDDGDGNGHKRGYYDDHRHERDHEHEHNRGYDCDGGCERDHGHMHDHRHEHYHGHEPDDERHCKRDCDERERHHRHQHHLGVDRLHRRPPRCDRPRSRRPSHRRGR